MKIPAGKFKAHCLKLMDQVQNGGEIIITKYGKPVAKLVPAESAKEGPSPYGFLKGSVVIQKDLTLPLDVKWNADE